MATQHEEDEAAVRRLIGRIVEGLEAKDVEVLREVYAADIVSYDVEPPLQHVGVEAKLENWAPVLAFLDTVAYEIRDLTVTADDRLAFGHALARLSGTLKDGSAMRGMWVRVTYCCQKFDDRWLIVHDQVSVPLDVVSGNAMVDLEP
ncbi:YybH family protein [Kitasatospora viridis]|uniref:Uncharacterized protein (TIGR02246 family) n=1 Tax=Kitasatospora viridis TaxID=281105 RepID=A0A561TV75_9ACTN|nr:nuclear transport factor 2 family protein [Kitasatospora viridis]TWF91016.1 uncharacterized protein (TIGR02246 family) [Kitasatospora viridis]